MQWFRRWKIVFLLLMSGVSPKSWSQDLKPWIYFDLGDTVINTKDMKHLKYFQGAKEYISELKRRGFHVGLITNIPETFGADYQEKFETLKKLIHDGWDDQEVFDWTVFDQVILPLKNTELKPGPVLFERALHKAGSCPSAYISENEKEVVAAKTHGFATKLFQEADHDIYVPHEKLKSFLKDEYRNKYEKECFDQVN